MKFWERLFERTTPRFGQIATWLLCGLAIVLAALPFEFSHGVRQPHATILSWWPDAVLTSPGTMYLARAVLIVSALSWAFRLLIPWSAWSTACAFTCVWALRMENSAHAAHIFHATNMLLFVHAMWFHFQRDTIRRSLQQGTFWTTKLYPNWVFGLSVFYLCWFHTWAGITKISTSGLGWGNGLSLQLWVYLWGWRASPTTHCLLASRTLTRLFQTGALVFETSSILGIFSKTLRWIVGLNLLGFYLGVLATFVDYGFHANAILVAVFLLPTRRWIERWERAG